MLTHKQRFKATGLRLPAVWVPGNAVCMVQAVLDMLGGSFDGIVDANLLPWAQLAWGAGEPQANTAVAASLVQRLDWQDMAFTLPGPLPHPCITSHTFHKICPACHHDCQYYHHASAGLEFTAHMSQLPRAPVHTVCHPARLNLQISFQLLIQHKASLVPMQQISCYASVQMQIPAAPL